MASKHNFLNMIQELLMKWGIPTYAYGVQTVLAGKSVEKIGDTLEVTVGWVYGLSINVDGVLPDNSYPLISNTQVRNTYLTLKYGQSMYVNAVRNTHFVFENLNSTGVPDNSNPQKYLPVNIPVGTDLKQSFYSNPAQLNNVAIMLNLFYIDINSYKFLLDKGLVFQNGQLLPKATAQEK